MRRRPTPARRSLVELPSRIHRIVLTVRLPVPRFWLSALASLGERVDWTGDLPGYDQEVRECQRLPRSSTTAQIFAQSSVYQATGSRRIPPLVPQPGHLAPMNIALSARALGN